MVSTPLKNISQNGNLPQIGVKIKNLWNHHPDHIAFLQLSIFSSVQQTTPAPRATSVVPGNPIDAICCTVSLHGFVESSATLKELKQNTVFVDLDSSPAYFFLKLAHLELENTHWWHPVGSMEHIHKKIWMTRAQQKKKTFQNFWHPLDLLGQGG